MDLLPPKIRKPNQTITYLYPLTRHIWLAKNIVVYATVSLLPIRYLIERVYERKLKENFTVTLYRKMIYQATCFLLKSSKYETTDMEMELRKF